MSSLIALSLAQNSYNSFTHYQSHCHLCLSYCPTKLSRYERYCLSIEHVLDFKNVVNLHWNKKKLMRGLHVVLEIYNNTSLSFSQRQVSFVTFFKLDPETQQSKYPIASQILMIYYILLYHDCYLSNLHALSVFDIPCVLCFLH